MAIVKSLFGEYFDCTLNMDIAIAEIVAFSISQEKMSAKLTIKPYRKIEEDRIKALEGKLSGAVGVNIEVVCDESRTGFHTEFMDLVVELLRDKIVQAHKNGILADSGMIAHGRGETYDYLIGEKTTRNSINTIKVAISRAFAYPIDETSTLIFSLLGIKT